MIIAGMVPNVEGSSRRRRCSHYDSNTSKILKRTTSSDTVLGSVAREAKERLDGRLRTQWSGFESKRHNNNNNNKTSKPSMSNMCEPAIRVSLQREIFWPKKKKLGWMVRMGWKVAGQEECAVCLEEFKTGEALVNLPCAHRFHSNCVVPWLHSNSNCPCCRTRISS